MPAEYIRGICGFGLLSCLRDGQIHDQHCFLQLHLPRVGKQQFCLVYALSRCCWLLLPSSIAVSSRNHLSGRILLCRRGER